MGGLRIVGEDFKHVWRILKYRITWGDGTLQYPILSGGLSCIGCWVLRGRPPEICVRYKCVVNQGVVSILPSPHIALRYYACKGCQDDWPRQLIRNELVHERSDSSTEKIDCDVSNTTGVRCSSGSVCLSAFMKAILWHIWLSLVYVEGTVRGTGLLEQGGRVQVPSCRSQGLCICAIWRWGYSAHTSQCIRYKSQYICYMNQNIRLRVSVAESGFECIHRDSLIGVFWWSN